MNKENALDNFSPHSENQGSEQGENILCSRCQKINNLNNTYCIQCGFTLLDSDSREHSKAIETDPTSQELSRYPSNQSIEKPFYAWYIDCLQKCICFSGRARRQEYWMFQLVGGLVAIGVSIILFILMYVFGSLFIGGEAEVAGASVAMVTYFLLLGFWIISYLPGISVCIRRIHDISLSGWLMLLALVPGGNVVLLVMMCLEGSVGKNKYGEDPIQNPPKSGVEFLSTVSVSYLHGLCAFSFFCPVCGLILWWSTRMSLPSISKKMLLWSVIGVVVTLAVCVAFSASMSAGGYLE